MCLPAGARRVWHSGSISTYKAHVWLYPELGVGIFGALAGPQRYDTTDIFYDLMHAISDLVVFNVHPPIPALTPSSPRPSSEIPVPRDREGREGLVRVNPAGDGARPPRPLSDYVGTYVGHWSHMNASVTLETSGVLRLTLGRMLTADLRHYDCSTDAFNAVITGRLWWVAEGVPQRALLSVRFRNSTEPGGRPDVLELPLEMDPDAVVIRRSRFTRPGLTLDRDWEPAGPNHASYTCSAVTASFIEPPRVWILLLLLLTVTFRFLSY